MNNLFLIENRQLISKFKEYAKFSEERNARYGNSMAFLENNDMLKLCLTKITRSINLLGKVPLSKKVVGIDEKLVDEIKDTINYIMFALIRTCPALNDDDDPTEVLNKTFEEYYQLSLNKKFITTRKYMTAVKYYFDTISKHPVTLGGKGLKTLSVNKKSAHVALMVDKDFITVGDLIRSLAEALFILVHDDTSPTFFNMKLFSIAVSLIVIWGSLRPQDFNLE